MNTQGIYGAYIFLLLHQREKWPKMQRLEKLLDRRNKEADSVWGLNMNNMPEATRVYLALCKRYGIEPEATKPL